MFSRIIQPEPMAIWQLGLADKRSEHDGEAIAREADALFDSAQTPRLVLRLRVTLGTVAEAIGVRMRLGEALWELEKGGECTIVRPKRTIQRPNVRYPRLGSTAGIMADVLQMGGHVSMTGSPSLLEISQQPH